MSKVGIFEWPVPDGVKMKMPGNLKDIEEENYLTISAVDNKELEQGREQ